MTSEEPEPEEEDIPFLHRLELIKELIEAPDEVIEALYDAYGKSMIYSAGGAAGAAAGVVLGGPVGGIVGGVVGKKTAGKFTNDDGPIFSENAPTAVGAYPHAHRVGNLLFVSGIGPRQAGTDEIPGGPIRDADGNLLDYDIRAQTRAVIENIKAILEDAGSSLDNVVDCLSFLINMDQDFAGYNEVYAEYFSEIQCARTTVAVRALPTPIAVELKVVAKI
ncbi:MAG: Rid family hydrolase [Candidatus Thalassarchaeum sp.]|nr:Rid family hydrolase [Candidatus Thalassarchaeum sp.]MCS5532300.1 Rid family hydrolase [Candidatus Poseidoniales archaeon]MEC8938506.1 Rid family hydrolase [Candidatus Thermoplasmatota archaeon]MEC8955073.1 Rid family hydrolase [Candidatus Thermoplasmatota archaeon]MEC9477888.1 Rid family hydrolase [Candidatus Thermoplasmatota archaeon]|tara:strand:+ start:8491 stop:9153 length:663 start_codon:yes stop_codon:yes gene_type:complete